MEGLEELRGEFFFVEEGYLFKYRSLICLYFVKGKKFFSCFSVLSIFELIVGGFCWLWLVYLKIRVDVFKKKLVCDNLKRFYMRLLNRW